MEELVPWNVYTNILKMLEYRGVQPTGAQLDQGTLLQTLNNVNYITINGVRKQESIDKCKHVTLERKVVVIMIAPSSTYATKSADFKKMLRGHGTDQPVNIIFISNESLTKHIDKQLISYKNEYPNLYIEDYDYSKFTTERPKHSCIPPHSIPTDAEVDAFCHKWFISRPD